MKIEETTNTVQEEVKTTENQPIIDEKLINSLSEELKKLTEELKTKVYPVKVETDDVLSDLTVFIETKAVWKNMEALGIIEVSKILNEQKIEGLKSGNIYMPSLALQALSFFLSKVENSGILEAKNHIKFIKPIDEAHRLIKKDNDSLNALEGKLAAAINGIKIEEKSKEESKS